MIVSNQHVVPVISSQPFNSIKLGVSRTGFSHLRDIVSNFIYSDKILAPIREYSTNAVDAHVEKGIADRPILVRLPNIILPTFAVRDYGYGLSREQIVNVFANYGESTKRGSNDAIGMLGIGSKSAFAYGVKSFMVISYQKGKKTTYVVSIEQSVDGDIVEFSSTDTDEEDGLEVQFGVKSADIPTFLNKASSFFQHWKVMPIFEGNTLSIRSVEKLYQGTNWYLSNYDEGCKLLMGNITYSLNYNSIVTDGSYSSSLRNFFGKGFVLSAPIGSVDIAASRETLQYTERTQKYIYDLASSALAELIAQIVDTFDKLPTTFEKKCMLGEFHTFSSPLYKLSGIVGDVIKSKYGTSYNCDDNETKHGFKLLVASKSRRGQRRVRTVQHSSYSIECSKNIAYVLADVDSSNYNRQLAPLIEKSDNYIKRAVSKVFVIKVTDKVLFDAWCKSVEFDVPLIKLSELPIVKMSELYPTNSNRGTYVNTNSNNGRKVLELVMDVKLSSNECFKPWDSTNDNGEPIVFVTIDRYMVKIGNDCIEPSTFVHDTISFCKMFGMKLPKIAAVRVNDVAKLDSDDYVPFVEYVTDLINDDVVISKKIADVMVENSIHEHKCDENGYFNNVCRTMATNINNIVSTDSVAYRYLKLFVDKKRDMSFMFYIGGVGKLDCYSEIEGRINNLCELLKTFIKTYPMIKFVDCDFKYYQDKASSVIDYINFVDSCKNIKPVDKSVKVV